MQREFIKINHQLNSMPAILLSACPPGCTRQEDRARELKLQIKRRSTRRTSDDEDRVLAYRGNKLGRRRANSQSMRKC